MQDVKSFFKLILSSIGKFIAFTAKKMYSVAIVTIAIILPISLLLFSSPPEEGLSDYTDKSKLNFSYYSGDDTSESKIARLDLTGIIEEEINDSQIPLFITEGYVDGKEIKNTLKKLAEDDEIKGVLINLNTPGGSPEGARLITEGIKYYKEKTNNPVFGYINSQATSAGSWISAPLDKIIAKESALVANVGVAGGNIVNTDKITKYLGNEFIGEGEDIKIKTLYRGKYKRFDNPFNPTEDEMNNVFGNLFDQFYDEFVSVMVENRKIDENVLRNELGAKALLAKDAINYNFIDELGNEEYALEKISKEISPDQKTLILNVTLNNNLGFFDSLLGMSYKFANQFSPKSELDLFQPSICNPNKISAIYGEIYNYCK